MSGIGFMTCGEVFFRALAIFAGIVDDVSGRHKFSKWVLAEFRSFLFQKHKECNSISSGGQ